MHGAIDCYLITEKAGRTKAVMGSETKVHLFFFRVAKVAVLGFSWADVACQAQRLSVTRILLVGGVKTER
jgi:hypothetical protein